MKKVFIAILAILLSLSEVNAACVKSLNAHGINHRTNGHQHQCLTKIGGYTTEGTGSVPSSCFSISSSSIVIVKTEGTQFCFSPQAHGNANITITVPANCSCSGESMSQTISFKLSEWGLKNLSITGYDISPEFNNSIYEYTAIVPNEVTSIEINPTPLDNNSEIKITGNDNLQVGENKVTINVVTPQGDSRDYFITVTRSENDDVPGSSSSNDGESEDSTQSGSSSNNDESGNSTQLGSSSNDYNPETGLSYMYLVFGLGITSLFYMIWYTKKMNMNN